MSHKTWSIFVDTGLNSDPVHLVRPRKKGLNSRLCWFLVDNNICTFCKPSSRQISVFVSPTYHYYYCVLAGSIFTHTCNWDRLNHQNLTCYMKHSGREIKVGEAYTPNHGLIPQAVLSQVAACRALVSI